MKRFLSLTLVAIMLLSTLMLTSCDPVGSVKGFVNKVLGREEESVRTTITAEEWAQASLLENFTMTISQSYSDGYNINVVAKYTADVVYMCYSYDFNGQNYTSESYYDLKEKCEVYLDENGAWVGEYFADIENMLPGSFISEINFENLVYDKDTKSYVFEDEYERYNVYFENGNLIRIVVTSTDLETPATATMDNFGTTTVTLPKYTVVED